MTGTGSHSSLESHPSEVPEIAMERIIQQHGADQLASNAYQKLIEQKERELRSSIMANYSRIKEVEKELSDLTVQLQVNVGPRKHALELLRNKIEKQNEKVSKIRVKHAAAKKVLDGIEEELKREEAAKDQLCAELGMLVQQSATAQLAKLEQLKNHLDLLNRGMMPTHGPAPGQSQQDPGDAPNPFRDSQPHTDSTTQPAHQHAALAQQQLTAAPSSGQQPTVTDAQSVAAPKTRESSPSVQTSARSGSSNRVRGKEAGGKDDVVQQKLLAEVAAARARHAGGATTSAGSTPRGSLNGDTRSPGSPRRAPAGAALMPGLVQQRQEAPPVPLAHNSRPSQQSRFSGFDV